MDKLEEYISNVLKQDKILVIVDDVERCEIKKAQEFIFFIKEIATVRNCVTIFLTDNVYLNQQQYLDAGTAIENPADNNYFYYEKFFNFRVDVPPIIFEEAMSQLEKPLKNEIQALRFRTPSEIFIVFLDKFQKTAQKYKDKANKKSENENAKKILLDDAETLYQLRMSFFTNFSTPRTLVKYCNLMKIEYSRLIDTYMQNEVWKEGILDFLLEIRFDEILFLLTYIEICAPYEARCLKEQGLTYLRCPDTADKTRRLIREMGEDLLYSYFHDYTAVQKEYLYNKASIFTQAYIDRNLPQIVDNFSSKDESWLNAIEVGEKTLMRDFWPEMIQMVLRDFAWRNPKRGEEYLNILFSFAKDQLSDSQKEREKIFSIFERNRYNEDLFAAYIPVMEIFGEHFKDTLRNCSWKNLDVLKSFSVGYFLKRTSPICRMALFMAPVEYSNDSLFRQRINDANEIMLNGDPSENLQKLLDKLCNAVPSIQIPHNDDVFNRLRFFANEAEEYMTNKELILYDSIKNCIQLLRISIDDMECFLQLLHETEKDAIPIGKYIPHISLDEMDITIQQFKHALSTPGANRDGSLQRNLQQLFNEIQANNIVLSDHHYKELQDIISYGEKMFGEMPYNRIILAHHKEIKNQERTSHSPQGSV